MLLMLIMIICYGMAVLHFGLLLKDTYSTAPPPPKDHNLRRLWNPRNETNRFYTHALLFDPDHRRRRSHMYFYTTIGFVVLIIYALSDTATIPT